MRRPSSAVVGLSMSLACVVLKGPNAHADGDLRARIDRLAEIVRNDSSFKMRALAARRLGGIAKKGGRGDHKGVGALVICLGDQHEVVRAVCAQALGEHRDPSSRAALDRVASTDDSQLVRSAAAKAASTINADRSRLVASRTTRRLTVQIGRVELARKGLRPDADGLLRSIRAAIEDRLEPHRPAVMPREDPDLRIDVVVHRLPTSSGQGLKIGFEARALLLELPGANLRHASQATASTRDGQRSQRKIAALEERIALEAVNRAVDDVLVSLLGG